MSRRPRRPRVRERRDQRGQGVGGEEGGRRMEKGVGLALFLPFGATVLEPHLESRVLVKKCKLVARMREEWYIETERKKILKPMLD